MPKIKITQVRCKGCGLCIKFCRAGLIVLDDTLSKRGVHPATFDGHPEKCTGCGNCAAICPEAAIEIEDDADEPACPAPTTTTDDSKE